MNEIFKKVVIVGPDYMAKGGIASVLSCYRHHVPALKFMKSNSRYGFVCGIINLISLLLRLPFVYLSGRKILHIHSASGKSFVRKSIIAFWGRVIGFKIVFHCHGGRMKEYVEQVGVHKVRSTLGKCDVVVVLSKSWEIWYRHTFHLNNIEVLNNSIDLFPMREGKKHRSGKVRFLFMGEICERKGVWDLLETVRNLREELDDRFEVIIGGSGETDKLNAKIDEFGLTDIVKPVGWIAGDEKVEILESADVILLPSYIEGLPVCILEGFAFGLPAIATTVGGIPDLVQNGYNGRLITPGDVTALAESMKEFIENPDVVESYSTNALKSFEPYSINEVRERLELIYEKVIS